MTRVFMAFLGFLSLLASAQNISMEFPHFAGKTYEFVIFQGTETVMVTEAAIPANGKFTLTIPEKYRPYTGMCRWLITNTMEGGGLDMLIPGKDFSVTCTAPQPDNTNIVYKNNKAPETLNRLYEEKQGILTKYEIVGQAIQVYKKQDAAYSCFNDEYNTLVKAYDAFDKKLINEDKYVAQFITIVSITQGVGTSLGLKDKELSANVTSWIAGGLDWEILYTSGHWANVISTWYDIHTHVLKDENQMKKEMEGITKKMSPKILEAFNAMITVKKESK